MKLKISEFANILLDKFNNLESKVDSLQAKSKEQKLQDIDKWLMRNTENNILPIGKGI